MTNLTEKEKLSSRRYLIEIIPATVIYLLMIAGSQYFLKDMKETIWVYPLVLSPLIAVCFIIYSIVNFVRRTDELIQKLHGDSAIITLLLVIFSGFTYGFLIKVGVSQPDVFWSASLICPLYFIVLAFLRWRMSMGGC